MKKNESGMRNQDTDDASKKKNFRDRTKTKTATGESRQKKNSDKKVIPNVGDDTEEMENGKHIE